LFETSSVEKYFNRRLGNFYQALVFKEALGMSTITEKYSNKNN